jgi:hypothetical protein
VRYYSQVICGRKHPCILFIRKASTFGNYPWTRILTTQQ